MDGIAKALNLLDSEGEVRISKAEYGDDWDKLSAHIIDLMHELFDLHIETGKEEVLIKTTKKRF